jgi:hypothetical protein
LNDGEAVMAYFDEDGTYIAVAKSILIQNLPMSLQKILTNITTTDAVITSEELYMNGETSYVISINEKGRRFLYQLYADGRKELIKIRNTSISKK